MVQTSYSQDSANYQINRYGSAAFTEIAVNPAFTGMEGKHVLDQSYSLFYFFGRSFDQYRVDYSTNFGKKNQFGVGGYYLYDKLGYSQDHEVNASFAYKLTVKKKLDIHFGLSAITYYRFVADLDELRNGAADPNDPLLQGSKYISDRLDYNAGLWLNYQKFYFGFAYLDFFTIGLNGNDTEFLNKGATSHINTGYDFSLAKKWHISPTIYVTDIFKVYDQYQFGLLADYSNLAVAGITYTFNDKSQSEYAGFTAGVLIAKRIRVTVGYEFSFNDNDTFWQDSNTWVFGLRLQY